MRSPSSTQWTPNKKSSQPLFLLSFHARGFVLVGTKIIIASCAPRSGTDTICPRPLQLVPSATQSFQLGGHNTLVVHCLCETHKLCGVKISLPGICLTFRPLNGGSPVSWISFLSNFRLLCPSVLDLRSDTGQTDRQTDRQRPSTLNAPTGAGVIRLWCVI